jgi:hypothetical protein
VDHEIQVLRECGCVGDFTFPSAPDPTQPRRINSIYYAEDGASLDQVCTGIRRESTRHLLLVQGVLTLNWGRRKWGVLPRLENSDLTLTNPPTPDRWRLWLEHAPRMAGCDNWAFVKLHSHGATPHNSDMFLGRPMHDFHSMLAREKGIAYHYVTAREMLNVLHAIEDGMGEFSSNLLEHRYVRPPSATNAP